MVKRKTIRVGVDLDGVIAKHPLGGFWVWLRRLKEKIFKKASFSRYYYPNTFIERFGWRVINWSKKPFADKEQIFPSLAQRKKISFYLVTSRFKFLEKLTHQWLKKHRLKKHFHQILINLDDLDPSEFKAKAIKKLKLDFFIDDDLETIDYLKRKSQAGFYWIAPGHKKKRKNDNFQIKICQNFSEALQKILSS